MFFYSLFYLYIFLQNLNYIIKNLLSNGHKPVCNKHRIAHKYNMSIGLFHGPYVSNVT